MYTEWPIRLRNSEVVTDTAATSFLIDLGKTPLPKLHCSGWDVRRSSAMWLATFSVSSRPSVQQRWVDRFGLIGIDNDVLWCFQATEQRLHRPVLFYAAARVVSFAFLPQPSVLQDHGHYVRT